MTANPQLDDFFSYLRFPSISADPHRKSAMADCADWLARKFSSFGFVAAVHQTEGTPVVLAKSKFSPEKKTILIYGHYDVQPVDPVSLWKQNPFEPFVENGFVIARGATDNKGQTICHILGAEARLKERGELPVNLIFLIEGEEEIGSPNLWRFLESHSEGLKCDAIVISDTSMVAPGFPAITCGLRGIACLEVKITGPKADLHSGMFGGAIANPATELVRLLAKLHHADGSMAVPGFYDDVIPAGEVERTSWREIPFNDKAILEATGVSQLSGEKNFTALERLWIRPTAEINGLTSGYQGDGSKTIIPCQASAKLSFRLVPNQKPDAIAVRVGDFLQSLCPNTVRLEITYDHGGEPFYADADSAFSRAARSALKEVFGREPALTREGLSIPIVSLLQRILGKAPLLIGLGLPDCNAHAPNETFPLAQLETGIRLHQALLEQFAKA
ncbi:MAG TPA: dipeptidase [Verrucomicrobiae bacterium]|jgi:acetylornithine deacetylase/succinyl-diaminopimelate desuccinylase-like protein